MYGKTHLYIYTYELLKLLFQELLNDLKNEFCFYLGIAVARQIDIP